MPYKIDLIEFPGMPVASIRRRVRSDRLARSIAEFVNEVAARLARLGVMPRGGPFTRIHAFEPFWVDLEAGLPVPEEIPSDGRVLPGHLPEGPTLSTFHEGSYEGLPVAKEALELWAERYGWASAGTSWVFYWITPMTSPDPSSWRTELFKPVRPSIMSRN